MGTAGAALALPAMGIEPFSRSGPRIKGLGMTTYSLKRYMKWWWGEQTAGDLDMLGFLDYCAELELDAAEITSYFFQTPLEKGYINQIKRRAQLHGLDIAGGAMGNDFSFDPKSDEAKAQQAYARQWIDHFADMGAPVVRVFASRRKLGGLDDERVIANVTANLGEALAYAEKRGVILGLENHDFVTNIDYLLRILKAIESRWLGVIWDSANLAPTPDPYSDLERIAPYAVTAQVKVMTKVNGEETPADYGRMLKILREANYRGYLIFEYEEPEDPYKAIPEHIHQLRSLL